MGIEKSVKRLDAQQKVTGTAKYVEDLIPVGALYTKVVHSTIANGPFAMLARISLFSSPKRRAGRQSMLWA